MLNRLESKLGVEQGGTTRDRKFTLETVNCLGCCALGPVVLLDDKYEGQMTTKKVDRLLKRAMIELRNPQTLVDYRQRIRAAINPQQRRIRICDGTGCRVQTGHDAVKDLSEEDLRAMDPNTAGITDLKLIGYERKLPWWENGH